MKQSKRVMAVLLALLLAVGILPLSAAAAAERPENTPKEEVVYINLNADGSVKEINAVNIFELASDGKIVDYGQYESVRNMTSTDEIRYDGETVTVEAGAGKLYYEGKLSSKVMPWLIRIRYYLDGREYEAGELAGKSGDLKITIHIAENPDCAGQFFEGCALQASVTLDTKKCTDIQADGATVANVGSDKQLTYTILPNRGADLTITARVSDFAMDAITINGVRLHLDIEIDESAIQEKIDAILGAVSALDDGAGALNGAAAALSDGAALLQEKTGALYAGVGALTDGAGELASGLRAITARNQELLDGAYEAFGGLCTASATILNAALAENGGAAVTLTPETYADVLTALLKTMDADAVYQAACRQALAQVTAQVEAQAETLYAGYVEQNAEAIYLAYLQSRADTLYAQVAAQAVLEQLMASGYSEQQAVAYLQTAAGQALVAQAVEGMSEAQKQQVLAAAVQNLTDEQKTQIQAGAVASLTDEQKAEIRNGCIEQKMKSEEVTGQITAAVAAANDAAAGVVELKGQLDRYSLFYDGLKSYTAAVSDVSGGAEALRLNMEALYANVGAMKTSVGGLNDGVRKLYDGTAALKDGADEFAGETDGMEAAVSGEVDKMRSEITGSDVEVTSFVSEKNTRVRAVQFVIRTEAIETAGEEAAAPVVTETLTFWQKLLRLFGLY